MTGTLRGGCVIRSDDRATLRDFTECRPHWSIPRACFVSFIFSITLRPSCSGARRQHLRWTQRTRLRAPSSDDRRIPCDVRRPGFGNQVRLVVASFPRIDDARALEERSKRLRPRLATMNRDPTSYRGNDRLLFGIILGVLAFWLFAQTTLNIAPAMAADLKVATNVMGECTNR